MRAANPGCELRIVDGEIQVRSPTALHAYFGGQPIRDADGFYPTGDLGAISDGCLYVAGRKHDLLIQAGRKYILSDLDRIANGIVGKTAGRGNAGRLGHKAGSSGASQLGRPQRRRRRHAQRQLICAVCAPTSTVTSA